MSDEVETIPEQLDLKKGSDDQILSFILGNEEYGVDILRVQEIKDWEKTTSIPNSPDYVMGVINLRGAVVPVVDLRVRFGLPEVTYDDSTVVIILRSNDERTGTQKIIGIVVDGVSDVHSLDTETLQSAPDINGPIHSDYVKGLATVSEKMVIVLHVDQLVTLGILDEIKKSLRIEE
ncbi:MAG: chemotaxis protein CheW [Hydrogenovibrio sp.]|nr:chemotaxis protein CheW [Hydrogenovibrio sp.]